MLRFLESTLDHLDGTDQTLSYQYSKTFKFNWNNYKTIKSSEEQLNAGILEFVNQSIATGSYKQADVGRDQFGDLCYLVGTYYNHVKRDPNKALELHLIASMESPTYSVWADNHLAFCHQQLLAAAKKENNVAQINENYESVKFYCTNVRGKEIQGDTTGIEKIKIEAFSYCVEALGEYEMGNMEQALTLYRTALDMYEQHNLLDDQYARAKNRWAMMLFENKQVVEAGKAYAELFKYWQDNAHGENMYAARFCYGYGEFLEKTHTNDDGLLKARQQYNIAYNILCKSDGEDAKFTKDALAKSVAITDQLRASHAHKTSILFASVNSAIATSSPEVDAVSENDDVKSNLPSNNR